MGYLTQLDYLSHIQDVNWQQIISNNVSVQMQSEALAQAEIIGKLVQKYDCLEEFRDTKLFNINDVYGINQLVYSGNDYYFVTQKEKSYIATEYYNLGSIVYYRGQNYICNNANKGILPSNTNYWTLQPYSVTGQLVTNTAFYTKGDNRSVIIYNLCVDIAIYHAHTRISPKNIPQIRIDKFNQAMAFLEQAQRGQAVIHDLPTLQPIQGRSTRFNSSPKNINTYL